jgi:hypothetical protein
MLAAEALYTQPLRIGIAPVSARADTFLMCHSRICLIQRVWISPIRTSVKG